MDKDRRLSRSVRLKKYESVYKEYTKTSEKKSEVSKKPKIKETKKPIKEKEPVVLVQSNPKKSSNQLNPYQEFVKIESKKEKYKNMKGRERMAIIAEEWEKTKRKRKPKIK